MPTVYRLGVGHMVGFHQAWSGNIGITGFFFSGGHGVFWSAPFLAFLYLVDFLPCPVSPDIQWLGAV